MRILVIDDDKYFTEPLVWCLEQEGWSVTLHKSVDDVFDAEGRLRGGTPDCIVLDIMMPWGSKYSGEDTHNGKDTGLRLLQDVVRQNPNIPIIIITVRPDLTLIDLKNKYGSCIKDILTKPIAPTVVLESLEYIFPGWLIPRK